MNNDQEVRLVSVPGTPFVRLAQDENMRRASAETGTIICETSIAELSEVKDLGPMDIVLDIGAFIGDTALIFASRGASVYAFEPQFDAFCAALINCRHKPFIHVINAAVGNGERVSTAEDPINDNSGTRTVRSDHNGREAVRLSEESFGRRVTFIKIDVEGFEPSVVAGAIELIKRDWPILLIEIYPFMLARHGFTPSDVTDRLQVLGYTIREAIGNSTEARWDVICLPPDRL